MIKISASTPKGGLSSLLEPVEEVLERGLDAVGTVLLNRIRTRFLATEAPDGTIWPESAAARRRQESGRDGKTLYDTGTLFHSIQLSTPGPGRRELGTDVYYGRYHQEGRGEHPKRVFLGWNDEDETVAFGVMSKFFKSVS